MKSLPWTVIDISVNLSVGKKAAFVISFCPSWMGDQMIHDYSDMVLFSIQKCRNQEM